MRLHSLPEILNARYGEKMTSVIFSVTTALSYIANIAAQLMAGKALFEALGFNGTLGVWVIAVVVMAYSCISGLWGACATSVVQVAIIIVSLLATFFIVLGRGAVDLVTEAVANGLTPANYFSMNTEGVASILITIVPISLAALCEQCTVQRIASAKSEKTSFRAMILSVIIMIPCALMPAFIGMYGYVLFGDTTNSVFFKVALDVLPGFFAALLIAAVVAAIMSTIDTMFVAFSTIIMHNIYRGMINPNASESVLKKGDFACHLFLTIGAAVNFPAFLTYCGRCIISAQLAALHRLSAACSGRRAQPRARLHLRSLALSILL